MNIEAIKEKARRHEQKEDWQKALDLYLEAIETLEEADETDISLFNRVGDLEVRMDRVEDAVDHYERAVDLYMESELPNNAIAVCKKVVRNFPDQHSIYLKMGQIRASQGFLTDARQNFLNYAEQKQGEGDIEAALNALIQFVELAPEDIEIRLALAGQLVDHDRVEEAVEQFREARRRLILDGRDQEAEGVVEKLRELAPDLEVADPEAVRAAGPAEAPSSGPVEDAWESSFADFSSDDEDEEAPAEDDGEAEIEADFGEISTAGDEEAEAEVESDFGEISAAGADEADEEADDEIEAEFGEISFDDDEEDEPLESAREATGGSEDREPEDAGEMELDDMMADFDLDGDDGADDAPDDDEDEDAAPLPTYGFGEEEEEDDDEEEAAAEATEATEAIEDAVEEVAFEERIEEPEPPVDEPEPAVDESDGGGGWLADVDAGAGAEEAVVEGPDTDEAEDPEAAADAHAEAGRMDRAIELLETVIEDRPHDLELRQRLVEFAYRTSDDETLVSAYLGLAGVLREKGEERKARSVYQQVLDTDPDNERAREELDEIAGAGRAEPEPRREVASSEEYVDLGSLVLDDEEEEKSTRFTVPAEAPSGDEQADFARMLDQFKEKVAANVSTDDVAAHYDLGTAYKEMGLIDEAIGEFQAALRAARDHLPTFEMLGQCFMEKGQYDAAARTLKKALDADYEVEDELLGIYYFLGRANEAMGDAASAVEYYDKVFELDINFMDVTERLRELR